MVNCWIGVSVNFHEAMHGFQLVWGMGTAYLESKPLHDQTDIMEEVHYKVFLDFQKSYNTLDRKRSLEILVGYKIGQSTEMVIRVYWEHLLMLALVRCYCGALFKG